MLQPLSKRIPERHRFLAILITSSVIGVVLLLVAVYNASKDLERLHDVDNLYRFANAQLHSGQADTGDFQHLLLLGKLGYRIMIVRGEGLLCAVELVEDKANRGLYDPGKKVAPSIVAAMVKRGVIARAMPEGDIIGFAPPLCITEGEVDEIVRVTKESVEEVVATL